MTRFQKLVTSFFGLLALLAFTLRLAGLYASPPDQVRVSPGNPQGQDVRRAP